jgi:hypothetical protein
MGSISKLEKMILEEGRRRLSIVEDGRRRRLPVAQLVVRRLFASGLQGGVGSAKLAMSLYENAVAAGERAIEGRRRAIPDLEAITPENARKTYMEMIAAGTSPAKK